MKAHVLAAVLATAQLGALRRQRTRDYDRERRGRAERHRFSQRDLEELFGDMEPAPPPKPPIVLPEPDFIAWDPAVDGPPEGACGREPPMAA